jgi:molybdopterin converting factor subunit 1
MRVTVRLFARLQEIAGAGELQRTAADDDTVRSLWRGLVEDFPGLAAYEGSVSAAVNLEYVRMDAPIHAGDEVAFLPPVSGGAGRS